MFNPSAPKSSHKVISLPPLIPLPHAVHPSESVPLSELVRNVSLSSCPDQEGCVVAIKFWRSCMSLCKLSGESSWSWTHINHLPLAYEVSSVIYSNAASMFYLIPMSVVHIVVYCNKHEFFGYKDKRGLRLVAYFKPLGPFEPPPETLSKPPLRFCGKRFLVETPSGDMFTIIWNMKTMNQLFFLSKKEPDILLVETNMFELYKHDLKKRVESYVGDIRDLCIFFGKNDPFCVSDSMYPGFEPNSIYFTENNQICVYHISTHTIHQLPHQKSLVMPYWLPPILPE